MSSLVWKRDRAKSPGGAAPLQPQRGVPRAKIHRILTVALGVIATSLCGCSESYIVLEIFAGCPILACTIPDQADKLEVTIFEAPASPASNDSSNTLATDLTKLGGAVITLVDGDTFPYDVLMQPSTTTPLRLHNVVELFLGDTVIGITIAEHDWHEGSVTRARITVTVPGR